ncbi:MAG: SMP-30/gluconolactonase/LRE family protein [Proteobacteria bacterium]|nr:SMP-30/gluconolactonase/LRE family protein [Pseudomonadota bacterium]
MAVAVSEPECLWNLGAELGEGALWSARDRAVWFVDIKKRQVHRLDPATGEQRSWEAPEQVGFVLPTATGGWIAGLQSGLHRFQPDTGVFELLAVPEQHPPENRLNDGFVDGQGRLWFGTMHDSETARTGALYRLGPDGACRVQDGGYGIPNGPAASPDGRTLYHTDTFDRVIYAFDLNGNGDLTGKREFARMARAGARPDGPVVDAEGCVWTALFGGWGLERYSPAGELLEHVRLPCANVTKAAFGDDDLRTVYVTTAKLHLSAQQREEQPLSGGLFSFRVDTPGLSPSEIRHGV